MNTLAYLLPVSLHSAIVALIVLGCVIWLIFYVLPLPQPVRTVLAVIIAALLILWLIPGCAAYQKTVDSRSIGVSGKTDGQSVGGKVIYSVHYR